MEFCSFWDAAQPDDVQMFTGVAEIDDPALLGIRMVPNSSLPTLYFTPDGQQLIFTGFLAVDTGMNAIAVIDLGG